MLQNAHSLVNYEKHFSLLEIAENWLLLGTWKLWLAKRASVGGFEEILLLTKFLGSHIDTTCVQNQNLIKFLEYFRSQNPGYH